jgi:putative CocE/NonD family hydrolase
MPSPKYAFRFERSVMIPMRDGVQLSTDLYIPDGAGERMPVVLVRTPYDKGIWRPQNFARQGETPPHGAETGMFAGQGFVVAVQDKRGRFESQGRYEPSGGDAEDGYDTVDWLAKQPWSNGRIGTYGCSYQGDVQIFQAPLRHPALKAMIPQASGSSLSRAGKQYRQFGLLNGGAVELAAAVGWFHENGSQVYYRPPKGLSREDFLAVADRFNVGPVSRGPIDYQKAWRILPVRDILKQVGSLPSAYAEMVTRAPADPWWDRFPYLKGSERFSTPALFINSWYDFGVEETLYEFNMFQRNAADARTRDNQFIIISPTDHCSSERSTSQTVIGERPVGDARFDYWKLYIDWFNYWLRGEQNGVTDMPHVRYYAMGAGVWKTAAQWPVPGARRINYFLSSAGRANSRFGDGKLLPAAPDQDEPADRYTYDPAAPVPSVGGPVCCTGTAEAPAGAFDQREVEARNDVLVYSTPPLEHGLEVTGPLEVVLYVSSSAPDTDFAAKLVDVYPDGTAYNVQEGILRARYREGFEREARMKPNEVYELHVDLNATSNYFGPQHQIRLEISSSNFPRFDRNLNTGGNNDTESTWAVATNTIHHATRYPSRLVLPIIDH